MAKRGPKPFYGCRKLMPVAEIANRLRISRRTVHNHLSRGMAKLRRHPEAFPLILASIRAVEREGASTPGCGSVECDRDFVARYAEVR